MRGAHRGVLSAHRRTRRGRGSGVTAVVSAVDIRLLDGFEDPLLEGGRLWAALLDRQPSAAVFQTRAWLRAWWSAFGRGRLLLLLASLDGEPAALAPWFADSGMVFPVGAGGSDE